MSHWEKALAVGAVALAALCALAGCGRKASADPAATAVPEETTRVSIEINTTDAVDESREGQTPYYLPQERVEADGKIRSYLTGELVDAAKGNRRPVAVMMSNDKASLPQYGINRAGVVYEAPVEGDMNRYMALIEDYDDMDRIGSVRSCRTYYTYFAREFDAIYAHFGQSTFAKPYLKNVDNINGLEAITNVAYYRTKDKKSPHNAYTSGERLNKAIDQLGYSREYASSYEGHYLFARDGQPATLDGRPGVEPAYQVKPGYAMNQPVFTYEESDGLYHRYQYGNVHWGNEGPVAVRNIIFQYCPCGFYATTPYLNINVHAPDSGFYITGGQAIPVTWEKDGEFGVTHYYDANHEEIVLNQGKTWVCILPSKDFDKAEITGKNTGQ